MFLHILETPFPTEKILRFIVLWLFTMCFSSYIHIFKNCKYRKAALQTIPSSPSCLLNVMAYMHRELHKCTWTLQWRKYQAFRKVILWRAIFWSVLLGRFTYYITKNRRQRLFQINTLIRRFVFKCKLQSLIHLQVLTTFVQLSIICTHIQHRSV